MYILTDSHACFDGKYNDDKERQEVLRGCNFQVQRKGHYKIVLAGGIKILCQQGVGPT
jgi:hypothetical protein